MPRDVSEARASNGSTLITRKWVRAAGTEWDGEEGRLLAKRKKGAHEKGTHVFLIVA